MASINKKHQLNIFTSSEEQSKAVANHLSAIIEEQIKHNEHVIIGFSGGSMPSFLAPLLAFLPDAYIARLQLFPVDERLVPLESEESNAGALLRLLPDKFGPKMINAQNIDDGILAAQQFEQRLRSLNPKLDQNGWPIFDLLLLGLGPDGHTCSLFPDHPLTKERSLWIAHIEDSPKPPLRRVTVTIPLLDAAANLVFIANGASKAEVLKEILVDDNPKYPPSMICPNNGKSIKWFVDSEAAKALNQ